MITPSGVIRTLTPPPLKWDKQNLYLMLQIYKCDYSTAKTPEQAEIANPTAPAGVPDQVRPLGALYPRITLLAGQLSCPPSPKPTKTKDLFESDSD